LIVGMGEGCADVVVVVVEGVGRLPLVDGAVSAGKGVGLGIFKSVQDGLVLGVEGNIEEFVDLVPHLGSGDVFGGGLGVSASCPLDARQFGVLSGCVHHEAHASGQVGLGDGRAVFRRSGLSTDTSGKDTESDDDGLGDQEDDEVGDVEGEDLRGG
jgi:hypothetical protein